MWGEKVLPRWPEGVLYVPPYGPILAVVAAKVARSIARLRGSMLICVVWSGLPKCAICTSQGEKVNILSFCGWPKTQTPLRETFSTSERISLNKREKEFLKLFSTCI